jgi:hypothetical protein
MATASRYPKLVYARAAASEGAVVYKQFEASSDQHYGHGLLPHATTSTVQVFKQTNAKVLGRMVASLKSADLARASRTSARAKRQRTDDNGVPTLRQAIAVCQQANPHDASVRR